MIQRLYQCAEYVNNDMAYSTTICKMQCYLFVSLGLSGRYNWFLLCN